MITHRTGMLAAGAMAAAIVFAAPASAQIYSLGTGKQGFFTYSAGAAIAKVAADGGLNLRVKPFGGTSAYVPGVNAGEQQFGLANELETHYAITGEVIYKDKPQPNLRVVAVLTPLYSVFFVAKDSPIKTIADLKGKRVPAGYASQRVIEVLTKGGLANGGLSYADIQQVPVPNVVGGASEFEQGKTDMFLFALGSGKVAEVNSKVPVRVLPIDHSKEAMERLRKFIPVAYATELKPGKGRAGLDAADLGLCLRLSGAGQQQGGGRRGLQAHQAAARPQGRAGGQFRRAQRLRSQAHEQGHGSGEIPSGRDQVLQGNRRVAAEGRQLNAGTLTFPN